VGFRLNRCPDGIWWVRRCMLHARSATSANLKGLGHTRCRPSLLPPDASVEFLPRTLKFSRQ